MGYLLPKGFQQSNGDLETRSSDAGICTLPREPLMPGGGGEFQPKPGLTRGWPRLPAELVAILMEESP